LLTNLAPPRFDVRVGFYLAFLALIAYFVIVASGWEFAAKIAPLIAGCTALFMAGASLVNYMFRRPPAEDDPTRPKRLNLDVSVDDAGAGTALVASRAITFLAWLLGLFLLIWMIGMLPALFVFIILYMRFAGGENWLPVFAVAGAITAFNYVLFDRLLIIPWPRALLGELLPGLRYDYGFF
jgi:hypothetical protein